MEPYNSTITSTKRELVIRSKIKNWLRTASIWQISDLFHNHYTSLTSDEQILIQRILISAGIK